MIFFTKNPNLKKKNVFGQGGGGGGRMGRMGVRAFGGVGGGK